MPETTRHTDFRSYLRILWRWKWLFLIFVIGAPVVTFVLDRNQQKTYTSSALVGVNQATVDTSLLSGGGGFSTSNVVAIAQLVTTTPVARVAGGLMHPPVAPGQIAGEVTASGDATTNFIRITATDANAQRAADIANAFAKAISLNRRSAAIAEIDSSISGVEAQLTRLGHGSGDAATRTQLVQQLAQLRAAKATQGSEAAILQAAGPSSTATGVSGQRSVELGLLIGLLLAFGAISLAEGADRRLRTPDDLEGLTKLPLLGTIGRGAFADHLDTGPEDDEAFQMLRSSLTYFNVDHDLESVLITSPGEGEGKTTVATRLALAMAQAGKDVILIDADLRRARVYERLGLETDNGLSDVLAGAVEPMDVATEITVEGVGVGRLLVVPAGPVPPNPTALLSSGRMERALTVYQEHSDIVIIDTPAALAVSDALPLLGLVSGVVMVARINHSSRQRVRRLQRIVESAQGVILGIVATGVTAGPGYERYNPRYYSSNGAGQSGKGRRRRLGRAG